MLRVAFAPLNYQHNGYFHFYTPGTGDIAQIIISYKSLTKEFKIWLFYICRKHFFTVVDQ